MGDPFDRSISLAFELVLQHHLDPWAIDLAKFSSLYIKRAKKERIDLVVAGKILYMAWKILNMQSYDVIINAEEVPSWDEYEEEQPSKMVVDEVPIVEPVRRRVNRRVSLIELIEAFDRARKEAEEYQVLEKLRRKERARILAEAQTRMHRSVHEEHFEDEIREVWKRIRKFNGRAIPLSNLCNFEDEEDRIITFVAVLHLANDGKIRIYQRKFPFGKIYVRCWDWKKRLG
jgi:segregation and condensation protein A